MILTKEGIVCRNFGIFGDLVGVIRVLSLLRLPYSTRGRLQSFGGFNLIPPRFLHRGHWFRFRRSLGLGLTA